MRRVEVCPGLTEVAVVHYPPGTRVTVRFVNGDAEEYGSLVPGVPVVVVAVGDRATLGWGARISQYFFLEAVTAYRWAQDRPAWDAAVEAVRRRGVAYIEYERRDWHGRMVWMAKRQVQTGRRRAA